MAARSRALPPHRQPALTSACARPHPSIPSCPANCPAEKELGESLHADPTERAGHPGVPCDALPAGHAHRWGGNQISSYSRFSKCDMAAQAGRLCRLLLQLHPEVDCWPLLPLACHPTCALLPAPCNRLPDYKDAQTQARFICTALCCYCCRASGHV